MPGSGAEPSGSAWSLQSSQVDVRVVVLRGQNNACGWMRISNTSRISVFNLSFDIRAETIEQITIFAVVLSWFLHVQNVMHLPNSVFDMQNLVLFHIA